MNISQQLANVSLGVAQLAVRFLVSFSARLRLVPGLPHMRPIALAPARRRCWDQPADSSAGVKTIEEQTDQYR